MGMDCQIPECSFPAAAGTPVCDLHLRVAPTYRYPPPMWGNPAYLRTTLARVWSRCRVLPSGCWAYTRQEPNGYGWKVVGPDGTSGWTPHRAVLAALGENRPGFDAGHLCLERACCRPDHLAWQTRAENLALRRPRAPNPTCTRCKAAPKVPGQGWCQPCFTAYYRDRRAKLRAKRRA